MKTCKKCDVPKELDEFSKRKNAKDGLNYWCKQCNSDYILDNKEQHQTSLKIWYKKNKELVNTRSKTYNYSEKGKISNKKSREKNKETTYQKNKIYTKNKYKNNSLYRLKIIIRTRIYSILKGNKNHKSIEIIGCTIKEYKNHLEKQFKPEMSWENHGKIWEIDHIKPCDSFNLITLEEQQKCFHYNNVQPLFKTTEIAESFGYSNEIGNREKSNKIL